MNEDVKKNWLAVDPGETTGYSIWRDTDLLYADQLPLIEFADDVDEWLTSGLCPPRLADLEPEHKAPLGGILSEKWQIYPWEAHPGKLDWDECRTANLIGMLQLLARQHNIKIKQQGADIKEPAMSAGAGELFLTPLHPNRHANDSIMHGVFYTAVNQEGLV